MIHKRRTYDLTFVKCPEGDIALSECQECPFHKEIRRRRVYCYKEEEEDAKKR